MTLQQIIDERISFLKEQINPNNKPEINKTFQVLINGIKSVDDCDTVEYIIEEKEALLRSTKDALGTYRLQLMNMRANFQ